MKIILFLLSNLFLVNSLALTNKIGSKLRRDSVDIPDEEDYDDDKIDSVNIDDGPGDENDDGIFVPEKETEPEIPLPVTKIDIKLDNLTPINQQFSEIMNKGLNEIRHEIRNIERECRLDFQRGNALYVDNRRNIASLKDKVHLIETKELKVLHAKIQQKDTIIKELRDGILKLTSKTEGLIKDKNIARDEFVKEKSRINKLIEQLDKKFKSIPTVKT